VKVIDLHRFCLHPAYDKLRHHIMREMSLLLMLSHRRGVAAQGQCRLCRFPVVDSSYSCCGGVNIGLTMLNMLMVWIVDIEDIADIGDIAD